MSVEATLVVFLDEVDWRYESCMLCPDRAVNLYNFPRPRDQYLPVDLCPYHFDLWLRDAQARESVTAFPGRRVSRYMRVFPPNIYVAHPYCQTTGYVVFLIASDAAPDILGAALRANRISLSRPVIGKVRP